MKSIVSALLVGASLLAAAPASAVSYITYNIVAVGTYSDWPYFEPRARTSYLTYVAPVSGYENGLGETSTITPDAFTFSDPYDTGSYAGMGTYFSRTATSLTIREGRQMYKVDTFARVNATGTSPDMLPFSQFVCAENCGTLEYGTFGINGFSGRIESITATFTAGPLAVNGAGVTMISFIPEPSTWAMMLIGTAGVAASLRRRRRNVDGASSTQVSTS